MSVVKIKPHKDAKKLEFYIKQKDKALSDDLIVTSVHMIGGEDEREYEHYKDFKHDQKVFNWKSKNEAYHIIQSFSKDEVKHLTRDQIHDLGRTLVERAYPNHSAVIASHFDTNNPHNHIMLNPISSSGANRILNKLHQRDHIISINDQLSLANGLKVIIPEDGNRLKEVHKLMQIVGKFSFVADIREKALFAQRYSRNFLEHTKIMHDLGINVRVGSATVSYKHFLQNKAKRSWRLDKSLEYNSMKYTFKGNVIRYRDVDLNTLLRNDPDYHKLKLKNSKVLADFENRKKITLETVGKTDDSNKYIISKKFKGIFIRNGNTSILVKENDANFKEVLKKAKNQQREYIKNKFLENATSYIKSKELDGIYVFNEKGKSFLIKKFDKEFFVVESKAIKQIGEFKKLKDNKILNDRKIIEHYRKKAKIKVIDSKGNCTFINPIDHKDLYNELKIEELFSLRNNTKYLIHSNAKRNFINRKDISLINNKFINREINKLKRVFSKDPIELRIPEFNTTFTNISKKIEITKGINL